LPMPVLFLECPVFLSAINLFSFVIRHYIPRQSPCANATHCTSAFCSHSRCPLPARSPSGNPVPPAVTSKTQQLFFDGILKENGDFSEHAESKRNCAGLPDAQYTLPATGRSTILRVPDCCVRAKRTVTSPVVLYGCETWCLRLRNYTGYRCSRVGC
jgi:hypothetical protein